MTEQEIKEFEDKTVKKQIEQRKTIEEGSLKTFIKTVHPYREKGYSELKVYNLRINKLIKGYCMKRFIHIEEKKDYLMLTFRNDETHYEKYVEYLKSRENTKLFFIGAAILFGMPFLISILNNFLKAHFG